MSRTKSIGAACLSAALLVAAVILLARQANRGAEPAAAAAPQTGGHDGTNGLAALREKLHPLEIEHARLAGALAAAAAENQRLEQAGQQAGHAARAFKELADLAAAQDGDPAQRYPTPRHLFAGMGKQARRAAELAARWEGIDEENLSPEEKQRAMEEQIPIALEHMRLAQAAQQMNAATNFSAAITPEVMSDYAACYLYGVLDLDEAQFAGVAGDLERVYQQAAREGLLQTATGATGAGTNRAEALNQLNATVLAEIQSQLPPAQAALLQGALFKGLRLVAPDFSPPRGVAMRFSVQAAKP